MMPKRLAARMADCLFDAMRGGAPKLGATGLLRLDPLGHDGAVEEVTFSGGVSEYVYGWETQSFGDLGGLLAAEIRAPRRRNGACASSRRPRASAPP